MRTLIEVRWVKEGTENDDEPVYEMGKYWLLHWGLKPEYINHESGEITAISYTVAICAHYETGQIEMFSPDQLKVLGYDVKR